MPRRNRAFTRRVRTVADDIYVLTSVVAEVSYVVMPFGSRVRNALMPRMNRTFTRTVRVLNVIVHSVTDAMAQLS